MMGGSMMGGGWGVLAAVPMLLWWIVVIGGIVALVGWACSRGSGTRPSNEDRALAILRERYARGEISREEFDERKRQLA